MNKKGGFKVSIGVSSLLMILVVLALTIFAVLSYVTADSDYKLTQKTASGVTAYYDADSKAEEILAEIDSALSTEVKEGADAATYGRFAEGLKLYLTTRDGVTYDEKGLTLTVTITVDQTRALVMSLNVNGNPGDGTALYQVTKRALISTLDVEEQPLDLIS